MKRAIFVLISLLLVISSANAVINYVNFDAKFVKENMSELGDKKVYYSNSEQVFYKDRSEKTFERKYQTTYRDLKREYEVNVYRKKLRQTTNLGDHGEVYNFNNREDIRTDISKYRKEKKEAHPHRWRNFMTSSDYLNNYFN